MTGVTRSIGEAPSEAEGRTQGRSRVGTREALRFLMEAGQTLASTLDYERALQALADLAVPRVACMFVALEAGGSSPLAHPL
jgi:hypothetical protein